MADWTRVAATADVAEGKCLGVRVGKKDIAIFHLPGGEFRATDNICTHEYALLTEDKHHNRRGLVQGGVLMTFADRSCGMTARYVSGKPTLATVQLDTHFVEAGKIGELLVSRPHVVRFTRSLIFITTEVTVDKRCIAMASGVFKILKNES